MAKKGGKKDKKGEKKSGKKGGNRNSTDLDELDEGNESARGESDEIDKVSVETPKIGTIQTNMDKRVNRLKQEYESLRGGRVTADMFNKLSIDAYGSRIALSEAAQSTLQTANFHPQLPCYLF